MVYINDVLVYVAVLITVTASQPMYGRRRPTKYLPPKRTYNPVKEVVKKTVLPKKTNTLPIHGAGRTILPEDLPSGGGFFPSDTLNPVIDRIGGIGRMNRGMFPNDRLGPRDTNLWTDETIERNTFPSLRDRIGRQGATTWDRSRSSFAPMGPEEAFPRINRPSRSQWVNDRSAGLPDFIEERARAQGRIVRDPRNRFVDGFVDPDIDRPQGLRDLNPAQTDRLRTRLRSFVSGRRSARDFTSEGRPLRRRDSGFLRDERAW